MRVAAGRRTQNRSIWRGVILRRQHRGQAIRLAMTEWRADKLSRRLPHLQARAAIQAAMRQWFADQGFVEVETPILQLAPGAEVHLSGFATEWRRASGGCTARPNSR